MKHTPLTLAVDNLSASIANMQKYFIALMLMAVASATLDATGNKDADAVKSDSSAPVKSVANYRADQRIRRQAATPLTPNVPVINGANIQSTSLTRVQAPEVKTLASQLADNSVDSKPESGSTKQVGGLLGGVLGGLLPNSPQCVYNNNCAFIGLQLYVVLNILDPVVCGNDVCAGDAQCTHFTHNPVTGQCTLHKAPGTGGGWATTTPTSVGSVCGHIPKRSCGAGSLLSLCLGLNLGIL